MGCFNLGLFIMKLCFHFYSDKIAKTAGISIKKKKSDGGRNTSILMIRQVVKKPQLSQQLSRLATINHSI